MKKSFLLWMLAIVTVAGPAYALAVTASPTSGYLNSTVTLTGTPNTILDNIRFTASKGNCSQTIGTDSSSPYTMTWTPSTSGCGIGTYTITAEAYLLLPLLIYDTKTTTFVVSLYPVQPVTASNEEYVALTSTDAYPPAPGTTVAQTFATLDTPNARIAGDTFFIDLNMTVIKHTTDTCSVDYRIFDVTTDSVLMSGSIGNPTSLTNYTTNASITIPTEGEHHQLLFQFKTSTLFDSVELRGYSVTIRS